MLVVVFVSLSSANEHTIAFNVVPADAKISIEGRTEEYSNGSYPIEPGIYNVRISHPELSDKIFTVNLEEYDMAVITTFLSDNGNFDFYKLRKNLSDFFSLAQIASTNYNQTTDDDTSAENFISNFQKDYRLYSTVLPVSYSERDNNGDTIKYITVRADYGCDVTLCLQAIILSEDDKLIVEKLLKDNGFKLEDFKIEYEFY